MRRHAYSYGHTTTPSSKRTATSLSTGWIGALVLLGLVLFATPVTAQIPIEHEKFFSETAASAGGQAVALEAIPGGGYIAVYAAVPSPSPDPTQFQDDGIYATIIDPQGVVGERKRIADHAPWLGRAARVANDRLYLASSDGDVLIVSLPDLTVVASLELPDDATIEPPRTDSAIRDFAAGIDGRMAFIVARATFSRETASHEIVRISPDLEVLEPIPFQTFFGDVNTPAVGPRLSITDDGNILVGFDNTFEFTSVGFEDFLYLQMLDWEGETLFGPVDLEADFFQNRGRITELAQVDDRTIRVVATYCCHETGYRYQVRSWELSEDGTILQSVPVNTTGFGDATIDATGRVFVLRSDGRAALLPDEIPELVIISNGGKVSTANSGIASGAILASGGDERIRLAWTYELGKQRHARTQELDLGRTVPLDEEISVDNVSVCLDDLNSVSTLTWPAGLELRLRSPTGPSLGTLGSFTTGLWAQYGMVFHLVDPETGTPLGWNKLRLDGRLDSLGVNRLPGPCPDHLIAVQPERLCEVRQSVELQIPESLRETVLDIRVNHPNGPRFYHGTGQATVSTAAWARHDTRFYVYDATANELIDVIVLKAGDDEFCSA